MTPASFYIHSPQYLHKLAKTTKTQYNVVKVARKAGKTSQNTQNIQEDKMPKSTVLSPKSKIYRDAITTNDTVATTTWHEGLNTEDHEYVNFTVIPTSGANPDASIYVWDEVAEAWAVDADISTVSGQGANTAYSFSVACRGRTVLLALSSISAGTVDVYASIFGFSNRI